MTDEIGIKLVGESWYRRLRKVLNSPEFAALGKFLSQERLKTTVYPKREDMFKAFQLTPFDEVKIVVLGQDVYHNGSATGLAFAVPNDQVTPQPSLRIILEEVENDVYGGFDFTRFPSFDLTDWAKQGVLLLNTSLSVRKGEPGSHIKHWQFFTNEVVGQLNAGHSGLIWMLWGNYAKAYEERINKFAHHILTAGHPASACYGSDRFSGCKHFSKANELLKAMNNTEIKW